MVALSNVYVSRFWRIFNLIALFCLTGYLATQSSLAAPTQAPATIQDAPAVSITHHQEIGRDSSSTLQINEIPPAAFKSLESSDRYELFSLDPNYLLRQKPSPDNFHGFKILGSTLVNDPISRMRLNDALRLGACKNGGVIIPRVPTSGRMLGCFDPRHGIRVTEGHKITDFVICFHCLQTEIHDGNPVMLYFLGDPLTGSFLITNSSKPFFDKVLVNAGVPLPANPKD